IDGLLHLDAANVFVRLTPVLKQLPDCRVVPNDVDDVAIVIQVSLVCIPRHEDVGSNDVYPAKNQICDAAFRKHVVEKAMISKNKQSVVAIQIEAWTCVTTSRRDSASDDDFYS